MLERYKTGSVVTLSDGDDENVWTVALPFEVEGKTYLAMYPSDYPEEGTALWRVDDDDTFVEMTEEDEEGRNAWAEYDGILQMTVGDIDD